jgi:HlyD family secretion protein
LSATPPPARRARRADASIAQTKGRIAEIQLKILQIDEDLRTEVGKELAEIRGKRSELTERRVAAEDQLKRIDLVAPQDGRVFQQPSTRSAA